MSQDGLGQSPQDASRMVSLWLCGDERFMDAGK